MILQKRPSAKEACCRVKELLISSPIQGSPDFIKEFVIQADASDITVAGILMHQHNEGQ